MDDLVKAAKAAVWVMTDNEFAAREITDLVLAAIADLRSAGVADASNRADAPLFKRGVILYCKANFLRDEAQAERALKAYEALKKCMSLDDEYREG